MSALTWMIILVTGLHSAQVPQETPQPEPLSPPSENRERTPRLVVEAPSVELGTVREGQVYEISFQLTNAGAAEARIEKVLSSCACTVARLETEKLDAGASVTLFATFDTTDLHGRKLESIEVLSNDPTNPRLVLSIQADVERLYLIDPPHARLPNGLGFQSQRRGESLPPIRVFAGKPGQTLELGTIEYSVAGLTCRPQPVIESGVQGHELVCSLSESTPLGPLRATASIPIGVGGEQRILKLPIHGEVVADILYRPAIVPPIAEVLPGENLPYGRITLRAASSERPFTIRDVRCGPQLTAQVEELIVGREFHVTLAAATAATRALHQTVTIVTDSPDQPLIRIPVYAQVAPLVVAMPANIYLFRDSDDQRLTASFTLMSRSQSVPSIQKHNVDNPHFKVSHRDNRVTVELVSGATQGRHEGLVTVYTDVPTVREVTVPVIADVR